jgi:hypothetical protein
MNNNNNNEVVKAKKTNTHIEELKEVSKYLYFVLLDGKIYEGNEYKSDAINAMKELKSYVLGVVTMVSRKKIDQVLLRDFFERNGVSEKRQAWGLKNADKDESKIMKKLGWY